MKILLTTCVFFLLVATANSQNLVRDWVRARSYGDTHTMNSITAYARNPYSSIQRPYYPNSRLQIRIQSQYIGPRAVNIYGRRYAITNPVPTSLDRPIRRNIYVPRFYGGRYIYEEIPIELYYAGRR